MTQPSTPPTVDFETRLAELRQHVAGHGAFPSHSTPLGRWVRERRRAHDRGADSPERTAALEQIPGWNWSIDNPTRFNNSLRLLTDYIRTHGTLTIPAGYRDPDTGTHLGIWVAEQRLQHRRGTLAPERATALENLPGWTWTPGRDDHWQHALRTLRAYVAEHGRIPTAITAHDGINIGRWVARQRTAHRQGTLNPNATRELEATPGWTWNPPPGPAGAGQ